MRKEGKDEAKSETQSKPDENGMKVKIIIEHELEMEKLTPCKKEDA